MRKPFEQLVEEVRCLSDEEQQLPMGQLAEKLGVPLDRLRDAADTAKMLDGRPTYFQMRP